MTQLVVRPYQPADFLTIEVTEPVRQEQEGKPVEQWAQAHADMGPAVTAVDPDGAIVFCAGVHEYWDGTGEVWGVFSPLAAKHPHTLRLVRRCIDTFASLRGYVRLQAAVNPFWQEAVGFIERLGFRRECIMQRYGPNGRDMALYALIVG